MPKQKLNESKIVCSICGNELLYFRGTNVDCKKQYNGPKLMCLNCNIEVRGKTLNQCVFFLQSYYLNLRELKKNE